MAMVKKVVVTPANIGKLRTLPRNTIIRAYKAVGDSGCSAVQYADMGYKIGGVYRVARPSHSDRDDCGRGLHVGTKEWCKDFFTRFDRSRCYLAIVEFCVKDIAAVPYDYDWRWPRRKRYYGKFRVSRLKIVQKVSWR